MVVRRLCLICAVLALGSGLLALAPTAAQDTPPVLATNTPPAPQSPLPLPAFATNTPLPGSLPAVAAAPDAPFERYALRLWTEVELVDVLLTQIRQLKPGDADRQLAVQLLQNELERRFPGAPRRADLRQQLVTLMLAAPRGSVDMRPAVRPFIQAALNELKPPFDGIRALDTNGFNITITPANLDSRDATRDAVLHTLYPAAGTPLYEDYIAVQLTEQGEYQLLDSTPALPVAPLRDVISLSLERLSDVNGDGADELSLAIDTGDVNRELVIYGWRGGTMVNFVVPGEHILFGEIVDWPLQSDTLTARVYRLEAPEWGCLGERDVSWQWSLNYFRAPAPVDDFTFQNRLGCLLAGSEPLFEIPTAEAISTVTAILQFAQPEDQTSQQRAHMILAMLTAFNGGVGQALPQVQALQSQAEPGSWLALQTAAFLTTAAQPGATPVTICAALEAASAYGACNIEQALTRLFAEQPLRRDQPIEAQLAALGINVLDKQTISAIGKRDRQAFRFNLAGDRWWAFAPLQADVYTAEKIAPLPGYETPAFLPTDAAPPDSAFNALLEQGNPAAALNILDNLIRDSAGAPLAASARFLQALSYDLLADRTTARRAYFALWSDEPTSVWGQLAAAHLDKR